MVEKQRAGSPVIKTAADGMAAGKRKPGDETDPGSPQSAENICPECGGSGRIAGKQCPTCRGTGRVTTLVGDA